MLIDQLHQNFQNMSDLRMREIRVDKQQRKVSCTLSHPSANSFDSTLKADLNNYIRQAVPNGYACYVKYVTDSFTLTSFRHLIGELLKEKYPIYSNISKNKIDVEIDGRNIDLIFHVSQAILESMKVAEFEQSLNEYFAQYTCYNVYIRLKLDDLAVSEINVDQQERLVQLAINKELLKPSRYFTVTNVEKYVGKQILSAPMFIADLRQPVDSCVLCGKISNKTLKAAKNNPAMHVCKFTLSDDSGKSITCVMFVKFQITDIATIQSMGKGEAEAKTLSETRKLSNDKTMKKFMNIYDGMSVIVRGKVAMNSFSERLEMTVYDLCKCNIEPLSTLQNFSRKVAADYLLVKPDDYAEYRQVNFVDIAPPKSVISDKDYVVMHVNATGFNVIEDKIFAICCVKMRNGYVKERLFSYVNPEREVDEKSLALVGLSSDKLMFHPTITELISDLYKFTYGSILVGNNLAQILTLLNYYSAPVGYQFANKMANQSELLSELFANSIWETNVNYAKLEDVAKKCKVSCPSTFFCRDTATTVAQCMSRLAYNTK